MTTARRERPELAGFIAQCKVARPFPTEINEAGDVLKITKEGAGLEPMQVDRPLAGE
jgi:hypothetical protein